MFNDVVLRTVTSCLLALLLRSSAGAELSTTRKNVHVACYSVVTQCSRAAEEDHVARVVRVLLIDLPHQPNARQVTATPPESLC